MCELSLENLDSKTLVRMLREAPTKSEYNAVCLALRQQSRRNSRALELLNQLTASAGAFTMDDVERIVAETEAVLKG